MTLKAEGLHITIVGQVHRVLINGEENTFIEIDGPPLIRRHCSEADARCFLPFLEKPKAYIRGIWTGDSLEIEIVEDMDTLRAQIDELTEENADIGMDNVVLRQNLIAMNQREADLKLQLGDSVNAEIELQRINSELRRQLKATEDDRRDQVASSIPVTRGSAGS